MKSRMTHHGERRCLFSHHSGATRIVSLPPLNDRSPGPKDSPAHAFTVTTGPSRAHSPRLPGLTHLTAMTSRRTFLKTGTAALGAAVVGPRVLRAAPAQQQRPALYTDPATRELMMEALDAARRAGAS